VWLLSVCNVQRSDWMLGGVLAAYVRFTVPKICDAAAVAAVCDIIRTNVSGAGRIRRWLQRHREVAATCRHHDRLRGQDIKPEPMGMHGHCGGAPLSSDGAACRTWRPGRRLSRITIRRSPMASAATTACPSNSLRQFSEASKARQPISGSSYLDGSRRLFQRAKTDMMPGSHVTRLARPSPNAGEAA
jgi:hypothetical protein